MSTKATKFESMAPIFSVKELPQALEFYQGVLGFELGWLWGTPPDRASICRDGVEINLVQSPDGEVHRPSHVYVQLSGVDDYYSRITQAGARIAVVLDDRPYGMRDFRIEDASGNQLSFGQPTVG